MTIFKDPYYMPQGRQKRTRVNSPAVKDTNISLGFSAK